MKKYFSLFLVPWLLVSCASQVKTFTPETKRTLLFPNGTYQHAIRLTAEGKERSFSGVISLSDAKLKVIGLSPFQTTLFRIEEDRATGKVTTQIYHDSFKKFEAKLLEFYAILKMMMLLNVDGTREQRAHVIRMNEDKLPLEAKVSGITLLFSSFDENKIPSRIEIRHEKFKVNVEVTGYET